MPSRLTDRQRDLRFEREQNQRKMRVQERRLRSGEKYLIKGAQILIPILQDFLRLMEDLVDADLISDASTIENEMQECVDALADNDILINTMLRYLAEFREAYER